MAQTIIDMKSQNNQIAILIFTADWNYKYDRVKVGNGIEIGNSVGSKILDLYTNLVANQKIKEDSEVFHHGAYILIDSIKRNDAWLAFDDPYSVINRFINLLAIVFSTPINFSRVLISKDGFKSAYDTDLIHNQGTQTDMLIRDIDRILFDSRSISQIRKCWPNVELSWNSNKAIGRVTNSLTYFFYSWRSPYFDPICINLAIVLENLFSPESTTEVTHQLSFNIAHFYGKNSQERKDLFYLFKKFYGIRSKIIHGGLPKEDKLIETTSTVFHYTAAILKYILSNSELTNTFNSQEKRIKLFDSNAFK